MAPKVNYWCPGRDTYIAARQWWTATDDDGAVHTFKWFDNPFGPNLSTNQNGMTGEAKEWPDTQRRLHMCAFDTCTARWCASKQGMRAPCTHVRFLAWVPADEAARLDEEAARLKAEAPGSASSGDAVVAPSSAMGGGTAGVSPTVATDMQSAVTDVPGGELHVAASPVQTAAPPLEKQGSANAGDGGVGGGCQAICPPRRGAFCLTALERVR